MKLPFLEIYNDTFQGLELFKVRNEEVLASLQNTIEEVSKKLSNTFTYE